MQDNSSREPSQMLLCDYGTFHLLDETIEGQMLVSQTTSSPSDRICYHFLQESDGTQQVLQSYDMEKGIALVLINHQSDYSIPKLELLKDVPIFILTYENGTKLWELLCQCKKRSVFCSINTMGISEDIEVFKKPGDKCLTDSAKQNYYETEIVGYSEGLRSIKDYFAAEHQGKWRLLLHFVMITFLQRIGFFQSFGLHQNQRVNQLLITLKMLFIQMEREFVLLKTGKSV